jgi:hypothetical protein
VWKKEEKKDTSKGKRGKMRFEKKKRKDRTIAMGNEDNHDDNNSTNHISLSVSMAALVTFPVSPGVHIFPLGTFAARPTVGLDLFFLPSIFRRARLLVNRDVVYVCLFALSVGCRCLFFLIDAEVYVNANAAKRSRERSVITLGYKVEVSILAGHNTSSEM